MAFLKHRDSKKPVIAKLERREPDQLPLEEMLAQPHPRYRGVDIPDKLKGALSDLLKRPDQRDFAQGHLDECIDDYLLVERYRNALEMYKHYWTTPKPTGGEEG